MRPVEVFRLEVWALPSRRTEMPQKSRQAAVLIAEGTKISDVVRTIGVIQVPQFQQPLVTRGAALTIVTA